MILQYFKKKENEYKRIADKIYINILYKSKKLIQKNYFQEVNFDSSFELIAILLVFHMKILKNKGGSKYKNINNYLIENFVDDLDRSIRDIGIGDMSIGKHVKKYIKKFYYRVKLIDPIIDNYNNANLVEYLNSIKLINKNHTPEMAMILMQFYQEIKINEENI